MNAVLGIGLGLGLGLVFGCECAAAAEPGAPVRAPGPEQPRAISISGMRVNSMAEPISIDDPRPSFSWRVEAAGRRGVVTGGYELELDRLLGNGTVVPVWASGVVASNQTQFVQWPVAAPTLVSAAVYSWRVSTSRCSQLLTDACSAVWLCPVAVHVTAPPAMRCQPDLGHQVDVPIWCSDAQQPRSPSN